MTCRGRYGNRAVWQAGRIMATYVRSILQDDEYVLFVTRLHWVIYARAIVCIMAAPLLSGTLAGAVESQGVRTLALGGGLVLMILGLYAALKAWWRRFGTEIVVTDRRVIHKQGVLVRRTVDINVVRIESVDVEQGLLGRWLGYGDVTLRGTGGGMETIRRVARPLDLRNAALAE
ncbi:putative membrane associated protein [Granulibacter bethesdensis]|uniref:Membrane associated protein n=2 Tax=Granulibacter bethesdensis TaxID=364410 RepID=A0AAC9K7N3_9PROT|nr:putative membrane associated protein [Granulibacter bethesdensis]APH60897.1 putative membrane associated protein [Granulibacter bethesdensis]